MMGTFTELTDVKTSVDSIVFSSACLKDPCSASCFLH